MNEMCDQEGCSEPATHAYTWEWGKSGTVCAKHLMVLQQTAANLGRTIQFAPINAQATTPLQREERVRLKSEALVLQEELDEAKARGLEMYRQNTLLTAQVQSLTVRNREAEAQRTDALKVRDQADVRLAELEAENATLSDELGRLRVLVDYPQPQQHDDTQPGVGQQ